MPRKAGRDDFVSLAAVPAFLIGMLLVGTMPNDVRGQELGGRVVDASSANPVPLAHVRVLGRDGEVFYQTEATAEGGFSIHVDEILPDTMFLSIEAFGYYSVYEGPFGKEDIKGARVEVALRPMAVAIAGIDVQVDARVPQLERVGFYRRRQYEHGYFLDAEAIEQRLEARSIADLLGAAVPGVGVDNQGNISLRGMGSLRAAKCGYRVFLDGILVPAEPGWATRTQGIVSPPDLAGIEVYRSPAQVPVQYGGANAGCGVILLWTLSGESGPR